MDICGKNNMTCEKDTGRTMVNGKALGFDRGGHGVQRDVKTDKKQKTWITNVADLSKKKRNYRVYNRYPHKDGKL